MDLNRFLMDDVADPWAALPAERWRHAVDIRDFMLGPGRLCPDPTKTLADLSERLNAAGMPLDRCVTIVRLLHSEAAASVRMWQRGEGTTQFTYPYVAGTAAGYAASPSALAHESRKWVAFNPQDIPDDTFGVVPELKQAGMTGYICAPVFMANGMQNVFTFATRAPDGFGSADIALKTMARRHAVMP